MTETGTRTKATRERRRTIVEAAALCFSEKGFHGTSIRDIANRAGVSLGNVYNHFADKVALIAEIASLEAEDIDGLEGEFGPDAGGSPTLEQFVGRYFDQSRDPIVSRLSAEILAEALRNSDIRAGYRANRDRLQRIVAHQMRQATGKEVTISDAAMALDLIEGAAYASVLQEDEKSCDRVSGLVQAICRLTNKL